MGYGIILHGVKFFRALSFFTSTEFLGVMFPQYISRYGLRQDEVSARTIAERNETIRAVYARLGSPGAFYEATMGHDLRQKVAVACGQQRGLILTTRLINMQK